MNVLVLNAGSSTLKFQLIATDVDRIKQNADERLCRGLLERIGGEAIITVQARNGPKQKFTASLPIFRRHWTTWFVGSPPTDRESQRSRARPISIPRGIVWCTAANCLASRLSSPTRC